METLSKENIQQHYKAYVAEHAKKPSSVYALMKTLDEAESHFYKQYASFGALENEIWGAYAQATVNSLLAEEVYQEYSAREKLLAFMFTLCEVLKEERSFAQLSFPKKARTAIRTPKALRNFRSVFQEWMKEVLREGMETTEVKQRFFVSNYYDRVIWPAVVLVMDYWLKDESAEMKDTDGFIEKTVNLVFSLLEETALEQAGSIAWSLVKR